MRRGVTGREKGDGRGEDGKDGGSRIRRRLDDAIAPQDPQFARRQFEKATSFRCLQCTTLKLKCSRSLPCERCFKLSLRCAPPSDAYLVSPAAAVERIGVASPLLELVFRNVDPAKMAQCFMGVFLDWLQHERIDRPTALATLRADWARYRHLGVDFTYGVTDAVVRALGVSSVDLEDPMELRYEPPPPPLPSEGAGPAGPSRSSLPLFMAEGARLRAAVESSTTWRFLSGPGLPASASVYMSIPSVAHTGILGKGGFLGTAEVFCSQQVRRASPSLLVAGLVAPDDLRSWFEVMLAGVFTESTQPCSRFIKMMDATGEIGLFLVTSRRVFVEEAGVTCLYVVIEPLPASRHLRPNPSHPHRVIHFYRHTAPPKESLSAGGGRPQAPEWMAGATATEGAEQQAAPTTSSLVPPCLPGVAAVPAPPHTLPLPARSREPVAWPVIPECVEAGFQSMCSTVASGLSGRNATGARPAPPPPPPPSTAAGGLEQGKEEAESESEETEALLWAALACEEGSDVPVFDGEEMLDATWAQGLA